jgi:hypothetical protein
LSTARSRSSEDMGVSVSRVGQDNATGDATAS